MDLHGDVVQKQLICRWIKFVKQSCFTQTHQLVQNLRILMIFGCFYKLHICCYTYCSKNVFLESCIFLGLLQCIRDRQSQVKLKGQIVHLKFGW